MSSLAEPEIPKPFQIKEYKLLIIARALFVVAMQMGVFSMAWYIYELTHDKLSIGLLGLSEIIPTIAMSLFAGHIVDKSDKRTLMLKVLCMYLLTNILLGVFSSQYIKGHLSVIVIQICIYLVYFCTGIFRSFVGPSMNSMIAQLVPRVILPKAITYSSTANQIAAVTGPVIAGMLIAWHGIEFTFFVTTAFITGAIVCIYQIPRLQPSNTNANKNVLESVREGLRFVFKTKELLGAMSLDMFAVFFGGAVAMLPVFAKDILHINAAEMGWLRAAQSIGAIISLATLSRFPLKTNQGSTMLKSVFMFGICIIIFAISKNYWLSFAVLFLSGIFDAISVVVRQTILQLYVPDEMRGRVSSVSSMFINSSNELGEFESGVAARAFGTVPSVIFGGSMTMLIVLFTWFKVPKLKNLKY